MGVKDMKWVSFRTGKYDGYGVYDEQKQLILDVKKWMNKETAIPIFLNSL